MKAGHPQDGAAAVEMAIITPLLFTLVFGIIMFGWTFWRLQSMEAAVREGGRLAAVGADVDLVTTRVWTEQRVVDRAKDSDGLDIKITRIELDPVNPKNPIRELVLTGQACDAAASLDGWGVEVAAKLAVPGDYAWSVPFLPDSIPDPDMASTAVFRCE